jgi:hypothetical protein
MVQEEDSGGATEDSAELTEAERRREIENQIMELPESERMLVRHELVQRVQELEELEAEKRQELVQEALGKFGFFLHLTAFLAGCSYLVLLAIFVDEAVPWVFIPIGLWCFGLAYHCWRAWHPRPPGEKAAKKP